MIRLSDKVNVNINGKLMGYHDDGNKLYQDLVKKRRQGKISNQINFSYNNKIGSFFINTDRGRARRAYIIVDNGIDRVTDDIITGLKNKDIMWTDLITKGIIEYLDASEEQMSLIALIREDLTPDHTHLEIDPVSVVGIVAGSLPYINHNMSARITMACSMTKQSLGLYASNYNLRMDSRGYGMYYPQKPLVQTRPYKYLGLEHRAAGQNFIVAVGNFYGYNMMDAVIINQNSISRGLGRSVYLKTHQTEERRYPGGQKDVFEVPTPTTSGYRDEKAYRFIGEDGIISPETVVSPGDVLAGKTSPPRFLEELSVFGIVEEKKRENSMAMKGGEYGIVDSVAIMDTIGGNRKAKVRVRSIKIPEKGDKVASRHGQKGVIGLIVPQEDMPFTKDGIVPDLIVNTHAMPSRMTMGHLIEMLGGKAASLKGKVMDGTAFHNDGTEDFKPMLKEYGFDEYGEEVMYDGYTGHQIKCQVYFGVIYYQRLHHLVSNKMHMRSRGPIQLLTRQPTEGRAREGGLRFGEMERDCLVGYGVSSLIKERLLEESDITAFHVCNECGAIGFRDYIKNRNVCPLCDSNRFFEIEVSYAYKLLMDEIQSLGVYPKLNLVSKA